MGVCNIHCFLLSMCSIVCCSSVAVVADDTGPCVDDLVVEPGVLTCAVQTAHVPATQANIVDVFLYDGATMVGIESAQRQLTIPVLRLCERVVHAASLVSGSIRLGGRA